MVKWLLSATLFALLWLAQTPRATANEVVYTRAFTGADYDYYHAQVLRSAIAITADYGETVVRPHPHPMPQARQILMLSKGSADVMWSATTNEREKKLLPVRLPLLQGLAGYRVFIIQKDNQDAFPKDMTLDMLREKTAVQGIDWPDLVVMQKNGFNVNGANWSQWFASMYNSIQRGVVDYFPRNVIEVSRDLNRHKDKKIELEQYHLLRYPNYEYFFVSPSRPELVERLEVGLIRLLESGELAKLFMQHQNHQRAMKLIADKERVVFDIENPSLSYRFDDTLWAKDPQIGISMLTQHHETK